MVVAVEESEYYASNISSDVGVLSDDDGIHKLGS